ncbi:hypothetical protein R4B61_07500 (plasmid) [Fructilactobacillus vespulae]|uniref:hypothetical protein n=1 Tax=Fructilactobacillus vespulae TaxID=1249630 RepID=UPI0039B523F3
MKDDDLDKILTIAETQIMQSTTSTNDDDSEPTNSVYVPDFDQIMIEDKEEILHILRQNYSVDSIDDIPDVFFDKSGLKFGKTYYPDELDRFPDSYKDPNNRNSW